VGAVFVCSLVKSSNCKAAVADVDRHWRKHWQTAMAAILAPAQQIAGRSVLLTGSLGFLDSVLLEQLLRLTEVRRPVSEPGQLQQL
jgi:hypothetical protein